MAPAAMLHIQQQGAGSVGVIGGENAGETVIDVIFGEQDFCNAGEEIGLLLLHPKQLGGGKPGKGDVAGEAAEGHLSGVLVKLVSLGLGAAVVPEDGGADHLSGIVQRHQAVHLARHPDSLHLMGFLAF